MKGYAVLAWLAWGLDIVCAIAGSSAWSYCPVAAVAGGTLLSLHILAPKRLQCCVRRFSPVLPDLWLRQSRPCILLCDMPAIGACAHKMLDCPSIEPCPSACKAIGVWTF